MALRCSLTGHSWGDPRTDVDRDEGLDEVAITEVEYRECGRCGEIDVISENTEVTAMRGVDDGDGDDGTDKTPDAAEDADPQETQHVATGDDAVIIDAEATAAGGTGGATAEAETEEAAASDEDEATGGREYVGIGVDDGVAHHDEGSYRCPDCGFSEGAAESSHRPGDLCPRCRAGYLDEMA